MKRIKGTREKYKTKVITVKKEAWEFDRKPEENADENQMLFYRAVENIRIEEIT